MACTNDRHSYQRMLAFCHLHRNHLLPELADSPYSDLDAEVLGLKSRAHPLGLALAFISLGSLDYRNKQISECYSRTVEILKEFDFIRVPTVPAKAKMGGFYWGFQLVYDSSKLGGMPLPEFLAFMKAQGIPALERKFGYLEYKRSIFTKGFDLWGRNRGPIGEPWGGFDRYPFCKDEDFPVTQSLLNRVFRLPGFIEVDPQYYVELKAALEKVKSLKGGK